MKTSDRYIPALGHAWLTSLYDPLVRWTTRESTFKAKLVRQADIRPGHHVLDLGCGTATLTMMVKRNHPDADVVGVDGDPQVLEIAAKKVKAAGVAVSLNLGLSDRLPFASGSFDRVLSSLVFHHLSPSQKRTTLAELRRVLRPGGQLHIADWGKAQDAVMRGAFVLVQLLDGFANTTENVQGHLPDMIRSAGFAQVCETEQLRTMFGTLSLYRAERP